MITELVKVHIESLIKSIADVESNIGDKAYLFMNNQTMKCLETTDRRNFEGFVDYTFSEEIHKYQYK